MKYLFLSLLAFGSRTIYAQNVLATQCYFKSNNVLAQSSGGPCGVVTPNSNFFSCCQPDDTCLTTTGLCYTRLHPAAPSNTTGYYLGGCTDSSFVSASCVPSCTDQARPDVIFNQTTQTWFCCGVDAKGTIHCNDPTNEGFKAPDPASQTATYTVPKTVSTGAATSTAAASSSATGTSAVTTSSTQPLSTGTGNASNPQTTKSKKGISGGAIGGIVVGAIAVVAVVFALVWCILRRRGQRSADKSGYEGDSRRAEIVQYEDHAVNNGGGITYDGQRDMANPNGKATNLGYGVGVQEKMTDRPILEAPNNELRKEARHELA